MKSIWRAQKAGASIECVVAAGCHGTELQVIEGEMVTRRERLADRSTAYERARNLRLEYLAAGYEVEFSCRA
ncbi:MAG: hypothetical protein H0X67_19080 [Acidobacteria bacterium]|nr:hypothetical protein [Acidobacteriota bacterium]